MPDEFVMTQLAHIRKQPNVRFLTELWIRGELHATQNQPLLSSFNNGGSREASAIRAFDNKSSAIDILKLTLGEPDFWCARAH